MNRSMCAAAFMLCAGSAHALQTAVWLQGAEGAWTTAANWEPAVVPDNQGSLTFDVAIGSGSTVVTGLNTIRINSLTLDGASRLAVDGGSLRVLGDFIGTTEVRVTAGGSFNARDSKVTIGAGPLFLRAEGAGSIARLGGESIVPVGQFQTRGFSFSALNGATTELGDLRSIDTQAMFSSQIVSMLSADGAGASLLLPELESIRTRATGGGPVQLDAAAHGLFLAPKLRTLEGNVTVLLQGNGSIALPSLEAFEGGLIQLNGPGASFAAPSLQSFDNSRAIVLAGNTLEIVAPVYCWTSTVNTIGAGSVVRASGAGSTARLLAHTLDLNAAPNFTYTYAFSAASGGLIDMPNLRTVLGPTAQSLTFSATSGGSIHLPLLESAAGVVSFFLDGHALDLPSLRRWDRLSFTLIGPGAGVNAPSAPSFDNCRFLLSGGAQFQFPFAQFRSDFAGSTSAAGAVFQASGAGSRLDASSLRRMDARFDRDGAVQNQILQAAQALSGGHIDLAGLRRVDGPLADDHQFQFRALSGGRFDFGRIRITNNVGLFLGAGSIATFGGDALFLAGSALSGFDGTVEFLGDWRVGADRADEMILTDLSFVFRGTQAHRMEAMSADLGSIGPGAANFRLGGLTIGSDQVVSFVRLVDQRNNAIGDDPESVYLGALTILNGSTLWIGDLNAYVGSGANLVHLNTLFAPGELRIAYSEGFVEIPAPSSAAALALLGACGVRRRR